MPKGLASVPDGFKYMMDGKVRLYLLLSSAISLQLSLFLKVSGQKITYRVVDTPQA